MCHVKQGCAVFAATGALARVLEADGSKNNYGQEYFIRETETQALSIDCPEAQQSLLSWTSRKLFCRVGPQALTLALEESSRKKAIAQSVPSNWVITVCFLGSKLRLARRASW